METLRLLLVDDEEGIRTVLGISLEDAGYDVHLASSGEEALERFEELAPEIVLTDIKMPGMSGTQLLSAIKQSSPETEVIMITGHGDMELAIEALKNDACDFVTKPIDDDILDIALGRAKEKISMRRQLREYTENLERLVEEKSARLIEMERQTAACQVIEGFSGALQGLAGALDSADSIPFLNTLPCLVSIHNRDHKIISVNDLFIQRLGNKVGRDSWAMYADKEPARQHSAVARTFETGKPQRQYEMLLFKNGDPITVMTHTAPISSGKSGVELVLTICADLQEVQRLQEDLLNTQLKFMQLFDAAPCYIAVLDRNLNIIEMNKRYKEDFGDVSGRRCYACFRHRDDPCPNCPVLMTFDDGELHQVETVVTSKTGDQLNVLVWSAPIKDSRGRITHVMELATDITQIRELQDHLTSIGMLVGSLSHGIKGLLTALDGGVYRVNSGFRKEDVEQIRSGWETVRLMVGRIRSMVLDILYYAKERDLKWEEVDVLRFATDLAYTIEPKMREQGIRFHSEVDRSVGKFEIDTSVVRAALINILENAIDACAEDKTKPQHHIVFSVTEDVEHVIFDVIDDGIGMDRETREKMFTLFFSSKGHRGTGLGLFICNKVVEQHGGAISVESEPGMGTHFKVIMPKVLAEELKVDDAQNDDSSG